MATAKNIIGIKISVENPDTGVPTGFHVISGLNIDFKYQTAYVSVESYFNEKLYRAGKSPVGAAVSITLNGVPNDGECAKNWAYHQLVAPIAEGAADAFNQPLLPHQFTGAALVEGGVAG